MNLHAARSVADYVNTGAWSKKAIGEAKRYCKVNVAATMPAATTRRCRRAARWKLTPGAAYVHYTPNETIGGVEFPFVPDVGDVPLVADMSSTILSRPLDVSRFGLIYAGAQKNIGPAGLVRRDRARGPARPARAPARRPCSTTRRWRRTARCSTRRRPTAWYVAGAGVPVDQAPGRPRRDGARCNRAKAEKLYAAIDGSGFYRNPVAPRLPLLDERAVHAAERRNWTSRSSKAPRPRAS